MPVKRYITAPDFSTAPPPDGPIALGSILKDVLDYDPLNSNEVIPVPNPLPTDTKTGFELTRGELLAGHAGVFAQILALFGVGVDAVGTYARDSDDVLSVATLETLAFNPPEDYVRRSMEAEGVRIYTDATRLRRPVYIVTGIKVARGAAFRSVRSRTVGGTLRVGFSGVPGLPAGKIGPDVGGERTTREGSAWEGSSDFVLAIRVRKLRYHKKDGTVTSKAYVKGARMMDGGTRGKDELVIEDQGEEFEVSDLKVPFRVAGREGEGKEGEGDKKEEREEELEEVLIPVVPETESEK